MSHSYSTVNLLRKCDVVLQTMLRHFSESALSEGPTLDSTLRREIEQLGRDMRTHAGQLDHEGVDQRSVPHPKGEGRQRRGATGKGQGRRSFPTDEELKQRRGRRTTGGVPADESEKLVAEELF